MKLFLFLPFVILMLVEVTLELRGRREKCQNVVSIGHLYSKIHILCVSHANIVKRQVIYPKGMRCHKPPYYFAKFLMFGASISWDCSLYLLVNFIFCLLLIMSRNRWKLKPPGLMILKLLQILSSLTYSLGLEFQEL